jgi:transcriptional regulator with XRE-family HTH domain
MILADKIVTLRKRAGWSQEELAAQLGVSRQSVSKWEGAQSVPDMQKVVQMSRLFGVTTDYLLKEELGEPELAPAEPDAPLRCVTMEQAADYLAQRQAAAPKLALATLLCVLSPVALLLLAALSDRAGAALSENAAAGIGLCVLLVLVAAAVAVFITCAAQVKAYAFLETEPFETAYGVTGMVRERRAAAAPEHTRGTVAGTVLCILSAVPLFIAVCLNGPDLLYVAAVCLLLVFAGLGSALFVYGGVYQAAMDRLLEEGDYARPRKRQNGVVGAISSIYWLTVTAAYLLWTFGPWWDAQPQDTWILWAVAGLLYGAVMALVRGIRK